MKEFVSMFLLRFEEMRSPAFQYGYIAGIAITVLMLLLLLLLYFLFRAPVRCKGIMLATPNGTLFISASAISDLVREVEKEFTSLKVLKSTLLEKKKNVTLDLKINFPKTEENTSLPAIAESFQRRIIQALQDTFGIDSIKEINIEVIRGKAFS